MLILTRKCGENIKVGENITISVIEIKGNHVRIGIVAPREISVYREEIYDLVKSSNVTAANQTPVRLDQVSSLWQQRKKER